MSNKSPFVSIIIANFNGEKYLTDCITSVLKTRYQSFEVVIFDDGSTDTSEKLVKQFSKRDERMVFKKNAENIGAAAIRNKAVQYAKGEIIVFLDNDTQVEKRWLHELVTVLLSRNDIGAVQSLLYEFDDRKHIQIAGVKLWAATGWGLPMGKGKEKIPAKPREIIAVSAALAVKKTVLAEVGGFDEDEAVVTEDLDLCWRIWISGYRILLAPQSIVYHWTKPVNMRKNMQHTNEKIYFHLTKNSLMSIIKNYQLKNAWKYCLSSIVISLGRSVLVLLRRGDISSLHGTLRGILWVVLHLQSILLKRKEVQQKRRYSDDELFSSVLVKDSIINIYKKYFSRTNLV